MKKQEKRKWSLNKTIVMIIIIGYAALLGVLFIANVYLISSYQNELRNQNQEIVNEAVRTAENNLQQINDDIYNVYSNNTYFKKLLSDKEELQQFSDVYEIYNELRNKAVLNTSMDGFFIFYNNLSQCRYYLPTEYNGNLYSSEEAEILYAGVKGVVQSGDVNRVWRTVIGHGSSASVAVLCKKNNTAVCGVYNLARIQEALKERLKTRFKFCLLDDMRIYADKDTEELAEQLFPSKENLSGENIFLKEQQKYRVFGQKIGDLDIWTCLILEKNWKDYFTIPQTLLFILTVVSLLAVIGVLKFIRRQYVKPIVELTEVMEKIRKGNWEIGKQPGYACREIDDISQTFCAMLAEIKKQKIQVYEETIEKQKAEMLYLQLQLKPHFFLNCLKTLNVMAIEAGSMKAQNFIINISDHLRYLLQSEREMVLVKQELDFVRNYIEMQKNMTGRSVEAEFVVENGVEDMQIPVLCIQTFVENSVKHARLVSIGMRLEIKIEIHLLRTEEGNFVDLTVSDNGEGYPEDVLEIINGEIRMGKENVGINNLKRRCRLLYKGREEYIFDNQDGAYSELIIPERRDRS